MNKLIQTLFFILIVQSTIAQSAYHHISNQGVYEFLDELASQKIIVINSAVKPYSREQIAKALELANTKRDQLNTRQQKDLDFYLMDFGKELHAGKDFNRRFDLFYFKDSLFSLTLNPLLGVDVISNDSALAYHRWVGAEARGYIGKNWAFYASLRDYAESNRLSAPSYLNQYQGGKYKPVKDGGDFSEMRGGVTYTWKWGSFGLVKDHISWGNGYNGANILGGRTPSFGMIKLNIKPSSWFELNYIHGWLVSEVIDSSRTYLTEGTPRNVFRPKYIAANFFTLTPLKGLNVSLGNSIIYSDLDIQPAYLTPIFFFKSVDHHLNGMSNYTGQNSQMFMDISSRQIKNLHLYMTVFVDEISMKNAFDKDKQSNFISIKGGFRLHNLPIKNLNITGEYTRTNPYVYKHIISTTTFESNRYNLGHYLQDNSDDLFLSINYQPIRGLSISTSYTYSRKGPDYTSLDVSRVGQPFMDSVEWSSKIISLKASYQIINDGYIYIGTNITKINDPGKKYTPPFLIGNQTNFVFGMCWGI